MKPRETQALSVHTLRSRGGRKEGVEGRGLLIGLTQLWPKVTFLTRRGHCLLPNRGPWKVEEEGGGEPGWKGPGTGGLGERSRHCPEKPLPTPGVQRPSSCRVASRVSQSPRASVFSSVRWVNR